MQVDIRMAFPWMLIVVMELAIKEVCCQQNETNFGDLPRLPKEGRLYSMIQACCVSHVRYARFRVYMCASGTIRFQTYP